MRRFAFIFGVIIVIIVVLADTRKLGFIGAVYDFPYGDKVGHFLLFGLFSLVVNLSMFETKTAAAASTDIAPEYKRTAILTSLIIAGSAGLEEVSQLWFPSRTASIYDLMASCLGIGFFTWLFLSLIKKEQVKHLLLSIFRDKPF
jgi:VanZ family protein